MMMEGQEPGRGARRPLRLVAALFLLMAAGASAWVLPAARPQVLGGRGAASAAAAWGRRGEEGSGSGAAVARFIGRREAVVMGLFGSGKAPAEPAPAPAKKGLFGLGGSGKQAQQAQQGAGGKKRKLVKKKLVKSSATKVNPKGQVRFLLGLWVGLVGLWVVGGVGGRLGLGG